MDIGPWGLTPKPQAPDPSEFRQTIPRDRFAPTGMSQTQAARVNSLLPGLSPQQAVGIHTPLSQFPLPFVTSNSKPQRNMDPALETARYKEAEVGVPCPPSGQTGSSRTGGRDHVRPHLLPKWLQALHEGSCFVFVFVFASFFGTGD